MVDIGLICTLLLGIAVLYRNAISIETQNLLTLTQQHRDLWRGASKVIELQRVFQTNPDLLTVPPTTEEQEFLNLAFVHFETGWNLARKGVLISMKEFSEDLRSFFAFPLRRAVWEEMKAGRNPRFVQFVTRAIERRGRLSGAGD